jgi:hypothetical protein
VAETATRFPVFGPIIPLFQAYRIATSRSGLIVINVREGFYIGYGFRAAMHPVNVTIGFWQC